MILVMDDNNLSSDDAKKIEAIRRQAALRKKVQSPPEDIKHSEVVDDPGYPFNYRVTALLAAGLLFAGTFLPFVSIPGRGDTPYIFLSGVTGLIMMILIIAYFVLTLRKISRYHLYIGVVTFVLMLFPVTTVLNIKLNVGQVQSMQQSAHTETMSRHQKFQDHRQKMMQGMGMSDEMIEEQLATQKKPVANTISDVEFRYGLIVMLLGGIAILVNGVMLFYKTKRIREEQFRANNNIGVDGPKKYGKREIN